MSARPDLPSRPGVLVAVVGASGVGKDSLINHARHALADEPSILFVQRLITRPTDGATEDHRPVTLDAFAEFERSGSIWVSWQAHGLHYGLPSNARHHVEAGGIAIANCSRKALDCVFDTFPAVQVVEVTALPQTIAQRLSKRGREDIETIKGRIARTVDTYPGSDTALTIRNDDALEVAGTALVDLIRQQSSIRRAVG